MRLLFIVSLINLTWSISALEYRSFIHPEEFDLKICHSLVTPGKNRGFYTLNDALHHNNGTQDYFLQKNRYNGRFFYTLKYGEHSYKLDSELSKIYDFFFLDGIVYVAGNAGLALFDDRGQQLKQFPHPYLTGHHFTETSRSIYYSPDEQKIYLASGKLGLLVFDLQKNKFIEQIPFYFGDGKTASMPIAITGEKDKLYIAMSSQFESGFHGIISYDLKKKTIINQASFDPKKAGRIDGYAKIYLVEKQLYLNNDGWIHRVSLVDILQKKVITPHWQAVTYQFDERQQYARFRGDLLFQENEIIGCAIFRKKVPGKRKDLLVPLMMATPLIN